MINERKTEALVRRHFGRYSREVRIEEQISDSPRINKLLATASKRGPGKGYPEFLISFQDNSDFLIVVECKADSRMHCSSNLNKYEDYAVDGALLYASHLSKDYDVLAIGVSGTTKRAAKVSHYLQLKGELYARECFGDKLLPILDYLKGYMESPQKLRQDYESLMTFIREFNVRLHSNKVAESHRSLLISAILIALERASFKKAYVAERSPQRLARMIIEAVTDQLEEAGIKPKRLDVLKKKFGFLTTETALIQNQGELSEIIQQVDKEVNSFIKNHKYRDVLGDLYVEFLRYANSDKSLGIVLTPPHITEFFADLAVVGKNDVVYDSCAGTGGFLISAMKKMIENAKGDMRQEKRIKKSQLYGVELQSNIYPLAVSNMYIHQDGKSNIFLGDCFDDKIITEIKKKKPTVGFLNPPYKANKRNDPEELSFVLNNLDCLCSGGVCIAIVPMQSALSKRGKIGALKKEIMQKHTLECVLSMPDELFFNSGVNIVSCVMAFKAHRPHPKNKKVYLGFYKDDGFVKRKDKGRVDVYDKWGQTKELWLENYRNRMKKPGLSVNVQVGPEDEWAAEAYMETNYSVVSEELFQDTLFDYSTYLFSNRIKSSVSASASLSSSPSITSRPLLNPVQWQWFDLDKLFDINGSKTTPLLELEDVGPGQYPYVTTQATNNGVEEFFGTHTEKGKVLTVDSAVRGYCTYQKKPFTASDHVEKLVPRFPMNDYVAMFLVTIMNMEQYRYNYGRKCSQSRLKESKIKLPSSNGEMPDFDFMEKYIKFLPYSANLS